MKKYLLSALIITIVAATGCKKDKKTDLGNFFTGSIAINIPSHLIVSQPLDVSLTISITEPANNIKYEFSLPGFSTEATINDDGIVTGLTAPSEPGTYTVTASATHPDYNDLSALSRSVIVIDPSSQESYSGYIDGEASMTDSRDNKQYYYTHIGNLDWFTSNLRWAGAGQSVDSVAALDYIYGRLYTWEEATGGNSGSGLGGGPQGICPAGWAIPTNDDWEDFASVLAGESLAFEDIWEGLGATASAEVYLNKDRVWTIYSPDNRHTNDFRWNGVPAGSFSATTADPDNAPNIYSFINRGSGGLWWSATQENTDRAYYRHIDDQNANFLYGSGSKKYLGASVRCVRIHP